MNLFARCSFFLFALVVSIDAFARERVVLENVGGTGFWNDLTSYLQDALDWATGPGSMFVAAIGGVVAIGALFFNPKDSWVQVALKWLGFVIGLAAVGAVVMQQFR